MMKATLVVLNEPDFLHNGIFSDRPINGVKNYGYMFAELQQQLAAAGIDIATQDINPPHESQIVIGLDEVAFFQTYQRQPGQLLYLLLNEPATYYPAVWEKENHRFFDRVFTYDYTLADGKKYIHHYFAIDLDGYSIFPHVTEADFNRRKLLVLMAGMFQFTPNVAGSNSLLYIRYQTLRWFGKHMPQDFDFYSRGIAPSLYRSFQGLGLLQRILPHFASDWIANLVARRRRLVIEALNQGPVPPNDKLKVLQRYRFVVSYENTRLPGYISEKLFDCLFAGCVPVYLGEPNIERFVPKECFVNRNNFATDAELGKFLKIMPYSTYARYLEAMKDFLQGIERQKFGSEANARRVSEVILADLK